MKAYLLRNHEPELIWSWEPEPQPLGKPPAAGPAEMSCNSVSGESGGSVETPALEPLAENAEAMTQAALIALGGAVGGSQGSDDSAAKGPVEPEPARTSPLEPRVETLVEWVQAAVAGIGVALRQQEQEIQKLKEQASRAEEQAGAWLAETQTLQSQLDILDGRIQTILAKLDTPVRDQPDGATTPAVRPDSSEKQEKSDSAQCRLPESRVEDPDPGMTVAPASLHGPCEEPAEAIRKLRLLAAESGQRLEQNRRRRSRWKRVAWTAATAATLAAGWWAYTQRGLIDAFRGAEVAPPPAVKAKIPVPALNEAPKAPGGDSMSSATSQKVSVVVTAKEEAWLEAEADGQPVFAKLLLANQTKSFDALRQIKILTGNLAGIDISHNGKTIAPLGAVHRVGKVVFTPEGWKSARM